MSIRRALPLQYLLWGSPQNPEPQWPVRPIPQDAVYRVLHLTTPPEVPEVQSGDILPAGRVLEQADDHNLVVRAGEADVPAVA